MEHGTVLVVAGAYVLLALADGGTGPEFRAGAAIVVWLAVILGLALGLWPRAPIPRPALVAGLCLAGFAALAGLSLAWASDTGHAFNEVVRVLTYLGLFVAVVLASGHGGARPWLLGLGLGLAAIAAIAVLGRLQPSLFPAAQTLREELPPARLRLSFPTGYWNGLGVCMALGISLLAWAGTDARRRLVRAAATAAIPLAVLALFFTSSRGALVAAGLGVAALLLFGRSRPALAGCLAVGSLAGATLVLASLVAAPQVANGNLEAAAAPRQGDLLLILTLVAVGGAGLLRYALDGVLLSFRAPRFSGRVAIAAAAAVGALGLALADPIGAIESFAEPPDQGVPQNPEAVVTHLASPSGSGRAQFWEVGVEAFASSPLIGIGAGGYESWWAEHNTISQPNAFAHSLLVSSLAELGIAGVALIVGFIAVAAAAGIRARGSLPEGSARAAALAVVAAGAFAAAIDWMWEFPAAFAPVVVAAALLTGPALSPPPQPARSRFGFGVAALVVGWLSIVAALLGLFGESKISDSRAALERGDEEEAVEEAETATTLVPWSAEPYLLKAAALEGAGDLARAREAIDEALARAPGDWHNWAVAARIDAQRGKLPASLEALAEANRRNPAVLKPEER